MPSLYINKLSKELNIPISTLEKKWGKAKEIVNLQYKNVEPESEQYYALVTSILKRMLKIKD